MKLRDVPLYALFQTPDGRVWQSCDLSEDDEQECGAWAMYPGRHAGPRAQMFPVDMEVTFIDLPQLLADEALMRLMVRDACEGSAMYERGVRDGRESVRDEVVGYLDGYSLCHEKSVPGVGSEPKFALTLKHDLLRFLGEEEG